jgi:hypothetical protein
MGQASVRGAGGRASERASERADVRVSREHAEKGSGGD